MGNKCSACFGGGDCSEAELRERKYAQVGGAGGGGDGPTSSVASRTGHRAPATAPSKPKPAPKPELARVENARKTGVFSVQDESGFKMPQELPENLRMMHIENCGLKDLPSLAAMAVVQVC